MTTTQPRAWLLLASLALVAGCPAETPLDDDTEAIAPVHVVVDPVCENLNPHYCMMPWPSTRYLVEDTSTVTGWRVDYVPDSFPANIENDPFDVEPYNRLDGFPPSAQIVTVFDAPVRDGTLPTHGDYDASLAAGSPTVVLDLASGERVAHFAEFDVQHDDPAEIVMYIRPATRLAEDRRYAVAIRDLVYEDGADVLAGDAFAALRDGIPTDAAQLEARRAHLEEVFVALEDAGVDRSSLILAWDFHTASGEALWGDLLHMRDDAMARIGDEGLGCTITQVIEDDDEFAYRKISGTFTVPLYMDSPYPPARLVRGPDGLPEYQGDHEVEFHAAIPHSLAVPGAAPGRYLTYGHGFFLGGFQVTDPWQTEFADDQGFVMVGTNWAGMSEDDIVAAATVLSDVSAFPLIPERLQQAVINQLTLTRTMTGVCSEQDAFHVDGQLIFDPGDPYFLGISLGSLMGTATMAMSQDVERAALHVGGAILPLMESRSINFEQFDVVYSGWYERRIDREFYWSVMGQLWEHADPVTYLPHLIDDPLPDTPAKKVLYTIASNDAEVANVASDLAGRTAGFELIHPTPHEVWGLAEAPPTPYDGSAMQYWDCGDPDNPTGNEPPEDNSAHQCVRRTASWAAQLDAFLQPDGEVINACDGPCDPE
jgi:hypothetical protein